MDYPHTTYVLDDGARDEVRQLAESLGVRYISRTDRTHAKAGNLNNALKQTDGEFVVDPRRRPRSLSALSLTADRLF